MLVHMIGNAHIDPVWLWPWQAGADEAIATMSFAADRCDEYPEFIFTRGEAWLYRQAERLRPDHPTCAMSSMTSCRDRQSGKFMSRMKPSSTRLSPPAKLSSRNSSPRSPAGSRDRAG